MSATPRPPFLVIRESRSFWVETRPASECSSTPQAFEEGCFREAVCYDSDGKLWPITAAALRREPTFLHRLLPWRRIPVDLQLVEWGPVEPADVVSRLGAVLRSESEFVERLKAPATEVLRRFQAATTPEELIQVAAESA